MRASCKFGIILTNFNRVRLGPNKWLVENLISIVRDLSSHYQGLISFSRVEPKDILHEKIVKITDWSKINAKTKRLKLESWSFAQGPVLGMWWVFRNLLEGHENVLQIIYSCTKAIWKLRFRKVPKWYGNFKYGTIWY